MRHAPSCVGFVLLGILIALGACRDADDPQIDESGHPPISNALPAGHPPTSSTLPAGHPPLGNAGKGDALPPGHPPIGRTNGPVVFSGDLAPPQQMLEFDPPRNWTTKPARPMTVAIYSLPGTNNSVTNAELAISHYPGMKDIPLQDHVDRWAGQFSQPSGETKTDTVKQTRLEGTTHPTTLVDISGTYQPGSMMGPAGPPQENHRMLSGIVKTENGPWFFKLTGPAETVAAHRRNFVEMLRQVR